MTRYTITYIDDEDSDITTEIVWQGCYADAWNHAVQMCDQMGAYDFYIEED